MPRWDKVALTAWRCFAPCNHLLTGIDRNATWPHGSDTEEAALLMLICRHLSKLRSKGNCLTVILFKEPM